MFETYIAVGIILSLIYYEVTHLSPGGLITPGYLALFIDQPIRIIATVVTALLTAGIVQLLKKYLPIYGRRQFAVTVTVAIGVKPLLSGLTIGGGSVTMLAIGVIVPGLIANDMLNQTIKKTMYSTSIVTVLMFGVLILMQGWF